LLLALRAGAGADGLLLTDAGGAFLAPAASSAVKKLGDRVTQMNADETKILNRCLSMFIDAFNFVPWH